MDIEVLSYREVLPLIYPELEIIKEATIVLSILKLKVAFKSNWNIRKPVATTYQGNKTLMFDLDISGQSKSFGILWSEDMALFEIIFFDESGEEAKHAYFVAPDEFLATIGIMFIV